MTLVALALASAAVHASWNLLVKRRLASHHGATLTWLLGGDRQAVMMAALVAPRFVMQPSWTLAWPSKWRRRCGKPLWTVSSKLVEARVW